MFWLLCVLGSSQPLPRWSRSAYCHRDQAPYPGGVLTDVLGVLGLIVLALLVAKHVISALHGLVAKRCREGT